jgi:hypothetical protein
MITMQMGICWAYPNIIIYSNISVMNKCFLFDLTIL